MPIRRSALDPPVRQHIWRDFLKAPMIRRCRFRNATARPPATSIPVSGPDHPVYFFADRQSFPVEILWPEKFADLPGIRREEDSPGKIGGGHPPAGVGFYPGFAEVGQRGVVSMLPVSKPTRETGLPCIVCIDFASLCVDFASRFTAIYRPMSSIHRQHSQTAFTGRRQAFADSIYRQLSTIYTRLSTF
jgi:hypothetical protein